MMDWNRKCINDYITKKGRYTMKHLVNKHIFGCHNIHETHVTANNSTNNNAVFFLFQIWK